MNGFIDAGIQAPIAQPGRLSGQHIPNAHISLKSIPDRYLHKNLNLFRAPAVSPLDEIAAGPADTQ